MITLRKLTTNDLEEFADQDNVDLRLCCRDDERSQVFEGIFRIFRINGKRLNVYTPLETLQADSPPADEWSFFLYPRARNSEDRPKEDRAYTLGKKCLVISFPKAEYDSTVRKIRPNVA
ncbi:MAG: hypothetical protein WC796_00620 [Candidatus Pacearchaeota archaeon]|jgi:hypothetical protein